MQHQKHEFSRKPRRLVSKSPNQNSMVRLHSKDNQLIRSPVVRSPHRPQQKILSLRMELGNLRQQLDKLQIRQKQDSAKQQVRSPRQKQGVNSYYFEANSSTAGQQTLMKQLASSKQMNMQLLKDNQSLRKKLLQLGSSKDSKRSLERATRSQKKEQVDITISYQKQLLENRRVIQQLKGSLALIQEDNQNLKQQIRRLRKQDDFAQKAQFQLSQKIDEIDRKNRQIEQMNRSLGLMADTIATLNQTSAVVNKQLAQLKVKNKHKKQKIHELNDKNLKMQKQLIKFSKQKDLIQKQLIRMSKQKQHLQKQIVKVSKQKEDVQNQFRNLQQQRKMEDRRPRDVKQLRELVAMHQKSLRNQQNDINYLQNEVNRLSFFKRLSHNQACLIDQLNNEVILNEFAILSRKYR